MKATHVEYSRVFNLGDYSNEKIGIVLELEQGDDPQKVTEHARAFVALNSRETVEKLRKAQSTIADPDGYTGYEVKKAHQFIAEILELQASLSPTGLLKPPTAQPSKPE